MSTIRTETIIKPDGTLYWPNFYTLNGPTVDVVGLSTDVAYRFIFNDVKIDTDNQHMEMVMSSDGGDTWDEGASDYGWGTGNIEMDTSPSDTARGDNAHTSIVVMNFLPNDFHNAIELTLFNPSGTNYTSVWFHGFVWRTDSLGRVLYGAGQRFSATAVDAVRFQVQSANEFTEGTLGVYVVP